MTTLTLDSLISETDDFEDEDLVWALNDIERENGLMKFGIDVIDWEAIGSGSSRQIGVLFDKEDKRYGYYTDNGETVLVELDKTYQELSDWGNCWDECPEVLQAS
jgi:hypothetical protein